jgi:hypothetical protein
VLGNLLFQCMFRIGIASANQRGRSRLRQQICQLGHMLVFVMSIHQEAGTMGREGDSLTNVRAATDRTAENSITCAHVSL